MFLAELPATWWGNAFLSAAVWGLLAGARRRPEKQR